jgi:plasmid stabilization system protein ParE
MKPFGLLRKAEFELEDAWRFYEAESPDLSDRFLNEFLSVMERLGHFPESSPRISRRLRVARLNKFRFNIIYQVKPHSILVVAIGHQSRKPGYWRGRI